MREKTHGQVIWRFSQGKRTEEGARITSYRPLWIRTLVGRYNRAGPEAMRDPRHENPAQAPLLDALWDGPRGGCMDEHRVGLQPILRRVWARRGHPPRGVVRPRYAWVWVVCFVHPERGRTSGGWCLHSARKSSRRCSWPLPKHRGCAREDGSGWCSTRPAGTGVRSSYCRTGSRGIYCRSTPKELQPTERVWTRCDEVLANRSFTSLQEREAVLGQRCCELVELPDRIRAHTLFHG